MSGVTLGYSYHGPVKQNERENNLDNEEESGCGIPEGN